MEMGAAPLRTFHVAGAKPAFNPTTKSFPLLMVAPRVIKVPPLNSRNPTVFVSNKASASSRPPLNTFVPRRMSRAAVAPALVTVKVPLASVTRLFVEPPFEPRTTPLARTVPPLVTRRALNAPS